jgi:hypothetical protein
MDVLHRARKAKHRAGQGKVRKGAHSFFLAFTSTAARGKAARLFNMTSSHCLTTCMQGRLLKSKCLNSFLQAKQNE